MIKANNRAAWADSSLLVVAAIWGGTFVMVKEAVQDAGPFTFLAIRFMLASLVLIPLVLVRRSGPGRGMVQSGALVGGLLFAGYALQTLGLQHTSASKAGFITGLCVVIVPVLAALIDRARPSLAVWGGVAIATAGLGLLALADEISVNVGDLLVLGCAVAFALHIIAVGRLAPSRDVLQLAAAQIVAAAILNNASALLLETPRPEQLQAMLPAAAFTGLFATAAAFYVQTHAQRFTSATHTALIFSTEPVFAALFGYLLAGDRLGWRAVLGCGLILLGMLVVQLEGRKVIGREEDEEGEGGIKGVRAGNEESGDGA